MSLKSDQARLEAIATMLDDIDYIVSRHGGVEAALADREGQPALMMCCQQLGEALNKIEDGGYRGQLPVALACGLRNVIAHDYFGVSLERVGNTIKNSLPELKVKIHALMDKVGRIPPSAG